MNAVRLFRMSAWFFGASWLFVIAPWLPLAALLTLGATRNERHARRAKRMDALTAELAPGGEELDRRIACQRELIAGYLP